MSVEQKIHTMGLQRKYFDQIRNGQKIYEGRLYDEKRRLIEIGDIIEFTCEGESFQRMVSQIILADTFALGLWSVGYELCIPDAKSLDEAVDVYMSIPSYARDESKYHVVFFKLDLIE